MSKTIKFEPRTYAKLNNALSLRLHQDAQDAIATCGLLLADINITNDELNRYLTRIELLADITKEAERSVDTKRINELDAKRDKIVGHVFAVVRAYVDSPFEHEAEAAERLVVHVEKYRGLQRESLIEETTHIDSFVFDINKLPSDIATLRLDNAVTELKNTNSDFKQLYTLRRQEQTAKSLPPAKEVRTEIDGMLDDMLNSISASYLISRDDSLKKKILALATELNSIFKDVKRVANQKAGQKKAASSANDAE